MARNSKPAVKVDIPITPASTASSNSTALPTETALTSPPRTGDLFDIELMQKSKVSHEADLDALVKTLAAMKSTSKEILKALAHVEAEANKVSKIGSALSASEEVLKLRSDYEAQRASHTKIIDIVKTKMEQKVEEAVRTRLKEFVFGEVQKNIEGLIKSKVEAKLKQHMSEKVRADALAHPTDMAKIDVHLHNAEARRINAMLSKDEPLQPLKRVLSPTSGAKSPSDIQEMVSRPPKFPRSIQACLSLSSEDAKALVQHYSLWDRPSIKHSSSARNRDKKDGSPPREDHINMFLAHVGAPFLVLRIVPTSPSSSPVGSKESKMLLLRKGLV